MKKLLITGIPGTGKTTIGNYLAEKYGFKHINLEDSKGQPGKLTKEINLLEALIKDTTTDLVITWGFGPDMPKHIQIINLIRKNGVKMFWLDGNRNAARKAFLERGTVSEDLLDIQMKRIDRVNIEEMFNPTYYDTFDKNGNFKKMYKIVNDILNEVDNNS